MRKSKNKEITTSKALKGTTEVEPKEDMTVLGVIL